MQTQNNWKFPSDTQIIDEVKYKLLVRQNLSQFSYPDKTNVLVKLYFQKDEKAVLSEGMIVSDQNIHSQLTRVCDLDRMRLLSPI